jgi:DNA-directed RNA polymerase specialized sigma24 family protein
MLSEQEIAAIILKVAENHKNKTFANYTAEDIKQCVCLIAWEKLEDFDFSKARAGNEAQALENWLNTVASNRLINLKRDKYLTPQKKRRTDKSEADLQKRVNLSHPLSINDLEGVDFLYNDIDCTETKELLEKVISELCDDDRDVLYALLAGEEINNYYKKKLMTSIQDIIKNA